MEVLFVWLALGAVWFTDVITVPLIKPNLISIIAEHNWTILIKQKIMCNLDGRLFTPGVHQLTDSCTRIDCYNNGFAGKAVCGGKTLSNCTTGDLVDENKEYPECCLRKFYCNGTVLYS